MYQVLSGIREATNDLHVEGGQSAATYYNGIPATQSVRMGRATVELKGEADFAIGKRRGVISIEPCVQ